MLGATMVLAQTQCLSLSSDIGYGMADNGTNDQILLLQRYLSSAGYLSATPTGYFGSATVAAVKAFQIANRVSGTGYVGPLTRAALNRLACAATIKTQTTPAVVSPVSSAVSSSAITSPTAGQTLTTGQTFNITWNSQPYSRYNLVLVSSSGAGAGFISQSVGNSNQYLWTVGNVYSSQTQSNIAVPAGSYQIRIENPATGPEPTDPISNPFTISAATLNLSNIFPTSVTADGTTAAVLYGSDLNSSISINFSGSSAKGQVLYASPDGRVLVFSVPVGTLAGSQSIYVSNSLNQSSNQLPFTITSP